MTFSLGATSLARLATCEEPLQRVAKRAIGITKQDFTILEGERSVAQQRKNIAKGVSWTMDSKHIPLPGHKARAFDAPPWVNGAVSWDWDHYYEVAAAVHAAAKAEGVALRWGAVWDRTFTDLPGDAASLKREVAAYVARRKAAGKRASIDGPHYELA